MDIRIFNDAVIVEEQAMVVLSKIGRKCAKLLVKSVIIVGKMVISGENVCPARSW